MGHGHSHGGGIPPGSAAGRNKGRQARALALTLACMAAGVVGGQFTGSLAPLPDAARMVTDAGGLALSPPAIRHVTARVEDEALASGAPRLVV